MALDPVSWSSDPAPGTGLRTDLRPSQQSSTAWVYPYALINHGTSLFGYGAANSGNSCMTLLLFILLCFTCTGHARFTQTVLRLMRFFWEDKDKIRRPLDPDRFCPIPVTMSGPKAINDCFRQRRLPLCLIGLPRPPLIYIWSRWSPCQHVDFPRHFVQPSVLIWCLNFIVSAVSVFFPCYYLITHSQYCAGLLLGTISIKWIATLPFCWFNYVSNFASYMLCFTSASRTERHIAT